MTTTPNSIASAALQHLGVIDPAEGLDATSGLTCLEALRSILDALNLDPLAVIGRQEVTRTPVAGTQSFTIGTGGDISSIGMPLRIDAAIARIGSVDRPLAVEPLETYLAETTKSIRGVPTYVAYERGPTVGTVYLYPAADGSTEFRLWVLRDVVSGFASMASTTTLTLPPGLRNLLEWAVADEVAADFDAPPVKAANAARKAANAMRRFKRSNTRSTELRMPFGVSASASFDINKG